MFRHAARYFALLTLLQSLQGGTTLLDGTLLGGSGLDNATAVAVDGSGNVYIAGYSDSTSFGGAVCHAVGKTGGTNIFIAKFATGTTTPAYCTFIGGTGDDRAFALSVDTAGNVYVAGSTSSTNFPVTPGALQASLKGYRNAFVAKLNASGAALLYGTYFGGSGSDCANAIAVDAAGDVFLAGQTDSVNLPVGNAFQGQIRGSSDAFVAKIGPAGNALLYGTYLGGSDIDRAMAIAIDPSGNAYITGGTFSVNFPTVNALQPGNGGNEDAFVAKVASTGRSLIFSTYLGGTGGSVGSDEMGTGLAVDPSGSVYVTGATSSPNFPVAKPWQPGNGGATDAFLVRLNPDGNQLIFGSYLGGSGLDWPTALALDTSGTAYVAGYTTSSDFPTRTPLQASSAGAYDVFLVRVESTGNLASASYFGGTENDSANSLAINGCTVYIAGQTSSRNLPHAGTANPFGGVTDAFVASFSGLKPCQPNWNLSETVTSGVGISQTFQLIISDALGYADVGYVEILAGGTLSVGNACYIGYVPAADQLYLLSDNVPNWLGPLQPGSNSSMANRQCTLAGSGTSVIRSGTNLILNIALQFNSAWAGQKSIYLCATSVSGVNSGYQTVGSWTVPPSQPRAVSVTPSTGMGNSQTFQFISAGTSDSGELGYVEMLIGASASVSNACYLGYLPTVNQLFLLSDNAPTWLGPIVPGSGASMSNRQCTVIGAGTSVVRSGANLIINLSLLFSPAWPGQKTLYLTAASLSGLTSGYQQVGVWSVLGSTPRAISITPSAGAGRAQVFQFLAGGASDSADLGYIEMLVGSTFSVSNACYIGYMPATNQLFLLSDDVPNWLGPLTPGSSGTMSNRQCSVIGIGSTVLRSGLNLAISVNLQFNPSWAGPKYLYLNATSAVGGLSSGYQQKAIWSVP